MVGKRKGENGRLRISESNQTCLNCRVEAGSTKSKRKTARKIEQKQCRDAACSVPTFPSVKRFDEPRVDVKSSQRRKQETEKQRRSPLIRSPLYSSPYRGTEGVLHHSLLPPTGGLRGSPKSSTFPKPLCHGSISAPLAERFCCDMAGEAIIKSTGTRGIQHLFQSLVE